MELTKFQNFLIDSSLWTEGFAALIAIIYYQKLKNTHWKYFIFYLVLIFLCESFTKWCLDKIIFGDPNIERLKKSIFYNNFVFPLQFIFFYWLFAFKSLEKKKLFLAFSSIYISSFIISILFFKGSKIIYSFNYTLGCLLIMLLVIMEYYKQINSENILYFYKNKMFYINLGVTLFYIGTLPFYTFNSLLYYSNKEIWDIYYNYNLIACDFMYLLFTASFIWGKQSF